MRYIFISLFAALSILMSSAQTANPKREFRGTWISTVYQEQYSKNTTEQNKRYLCDMLDKLKDAGINVVLFQARPSADAFYSSKYEPWSRYLTSDQKAPDPYWDPLEFMCTEAHKRGMELHAWLNPYRVTTTKGQKLPSNHLYNKEPDRFIRYEGDGKLYFDPGLPSNRAFIIDVINDIMDRYNIDGIHFDDYFYPYPANGKEFNDTKSYNMYGNGMKRGDWRRRNIDKLIEEIHYTIRNSKKPWVRFGVSPFGIWRNSGSDPKGSKTNGLQNYDDLYADVIKWAEQGWVDYLIPQLYWELEHKKASSLTLVDWWAETVDPRCQVYIGQDVERTMKAPDTAPSTDPNQLAHKIGLTRERERIDGNCWWPAYSLTSDFMGVSSALSNDHQSTPALVPAYPSISVKSPDPVKKVKISGKKLSWKGPKVKGQTTDPTKYVVYRFDNQSEIDFGDARSIYAITADREIELNQPGFYAITVIDRVNNESEPSEIVRY